MLQDWSTEQSSSFHHLSDQRRIVSYKTGLQIFKENPIIGTGIGDMRNEMNKKYLDEYGVEYNALPHNQFLSYMVGTGICGLLVFFNWVLSALLSY